jgi:2-methylcitrate dehydratase PrpD
VSTRDACLLTRELGGFLADIGYSRLPQEALPLVRDAFTDTLGVMMAGMSEPVVEIVRRTLIETGARREARACLTHLRVSAAEAALLGGTAAHALDYDDQSLTGHPSAVLVPAILAEGEALGSTGRELVTAYVAGYEVWAELVRRDADYHRRGWHPTAVFGVLAAAAAVAVLRRLPEARAAAALAIAASHAGGLAANFGTMTKPYHAGLAARHGVESARLAEAGMSAAADALEGVQGFLTAFSAGSPRRDEPVRVGTEWYLPQQRLCIKKYPTCYFMQRSFDAAVRMLAAHRIRAADVAAIEVTMGRGQTAVLVNERPKTGLEAKFSEQFAMAAAVILGRMGLAEVRDEVVQRPDIQAFFSKVTVHPVDEYDPRDPAHSPTERVAIRLANGEVLDSGPVATIRGHAYEPLTSAELWEKFGHCTALTHTREEARKLFDLLQSVDTLSAVSELPTCHRMPGEPANVA